MEIGALNGLGLAGYSSGSASSDVRNTQGAMASRTKTHDHGSHEHGRRAEHHKHDRATTILRQEMRQIFSASFRLNFSASLPAYAANAGDDTPEAVAGDTLDAAKQLVERSPVEASKTLVSLRAKVEQAASSVRETLGENESEAVDETLDRVGQGLDKMDTDAARNVASSASVLSVDTALKQRSTIRIRTQEGDVVRLDLRRVENMSATDVAVTEGDKVATETRVDVSSRTRSVLSVKGDLNDAEMAAIQNVFAQAEAIADEFFGGDLAAAFNMAAGMEFDTEQLARVNMRFRERQVSQVSYAALQTASPQPAVKTAPEIVDKPGPVAPDVPVPAAAEPVAEAVAVLEEPEAATAADVPAVDGKAIDGFIELLSNFLRATNQGFESGSFRYHYSESFKLEILKSVLQVQAPEESGEAANTAATMIDIR